MVNPYKTMIRIITVRYVLRALREVMSLKEPGILLCVLTEARPGEMKRLIDAINDEGILFVSVLAVRSWEKGKKAFFP